MLIGQIAASSRPSGEIVAQARRSATRSIVARCDLDLRAPTRTTMFNFAAHRRPEHYRLIVERMGAEPPPEEGR